MTNLSLAQSYLTKALVRLKVLALLLGEEAYSDVVREAQETVELALKGMLRQVGVDPPKWHDVGGLLAEYQDRFPPESMGSIDRLAAASAWLRKEREFAFYGDIDLIPTEAYSRDEALRAIEDAEFVVSVVQQIIPLP